MANFIGVQVLDGLVKVVKKLEKSTKHRVLAYGPLLARLQPGKFWFPAICDADPVDELAPGTPLNLYEYDPDPVPAEEDTLRVTP
jgi:hypothetical protein